MLGIAIALSGYASINRNVPTGLTSHLGPVNAEAVVVGDGGNIGDVSLGRYTVIIKPAEIPTSAPVSHLPTTYVTLTGDTINSIASKFGVSVNQLRWSNSVLYSDATVLPGMQLLIPPTPGVVIRVESGQTLQSLANAYHVDPATIADYNRLRGSQLSPGVLLVLPNGVGPAFPTPRVVAPVYIGGNFHLTIGAPVGKYVPTRFPWGWCTWYVATRRPIPWTGNAIQWYPNAAAMGYPEGMQPRVGAIMVTTESPIGLGHVSYVENVYPDGSWLISEMDYGMYGVTDQRLITMAQIKPYLVGFIYG